MAINYYKLLFKDPDTNKTFSLIVGHNTDNISTFSHTDLTIGECVDELYQQGFVLDYLSPMLQSDRGDYNT